MLAAPLELDHRAADRLDLLDGAQDLLLDQVEDLVVGDGQLGQQLAARQVMHDVHDLQDDAGVRAPPPLLRGDQQQVARRHAVRDLVGDLEAEVTLQVLDGRLAQLAQPAHVVLVVGIQLVDPQEAVDLVAVGEVQPMPVDDRAAAQEVPDRGQVAEREVLVADGPHGRVRLGLPPGDRQPKSSSIASDARATVKADAAGDGAGQTGGPAKSWPRRAPRRRSHDQASDDWNHTFAYIRLPVGFVKKGPNFD